MNMLTIMPYMYLGIGGFFFLYFVILWIHCGRIPAFGWFWPVTGSVFLLLGVLTMDYSYSIVSADGPIVFFYDENTTRVREFCVQQLPILLLVILAAALIGICILAFHGNKKPFPGADFCIILGAHVNGSIPSRALMSRIMTAYEYLSNNPQTCAILTGGQGRGEEITEAFCMKQEFLKLGISENRLFIEDKSTTTRENIAFAREIIYELKKTEVSLVIVTNDFHTLRGRAIAIREGFQDVSTLGSPSSKIMKLHYYTRELLSWIKYISDVR